MPRTILAAFESRNSRVDNSDVKKTDSDYERIEDEVPTS